MKRALIFVMVVLGLAASHAHAAGFVWEPTMSSYLRIGTNPLTGNPYPWTYFQALDPMAAMAAGLGAGEGYGTAGYLLESDTAYGGAAPQNLAPQGVNERPGHYFFGFANTYPTTSNFAAYELGNTRLSAGAKVHLVFRRTTDDPINFIGMCADTTAGAIYVSPSHQNNVEYLHIEVEVTDPVYSTDGGGDQNSVFGLYINYGNYDAANADVDYDGSVFRTNIHWWDIDVPDVPRDKLASIQLSTQANTDAVVTATISDSYLDRIGVDPNDVRGYIDDTEIPLGQGLDNETYSFAKMADEGFLDYNLSAGDSVSEYVIHSNRWSTHDIGVGVIPEPATLTLLVFAGLMSPRRRR